MIKDATRWRAELIGIAKFLEKKRHQTLWNESTFFRTEQKIMTAFYWTRKILESKKASQKVLTASISLLEFKRGLTGTREVVAPIIQINFDIDHPITVSRDLLFACHQIIHSYIFSVAIGYGSGFQGVYFASDRERNKRLFFMGAEGLIAAIQIVANDTDAEFSPWIEERLPHHRVQTAFPQPGPRPNCGLHLTPLRGAGEAGR